MRSKLFLATCALFFVAAKATSLSTEGKVVGITDGDTIAVRGSGGTYKVRLEGIDTPEKGQPYGNAAKKLLSKLVHGKTATINSKGKDRYGRVLADVVVDGKSANLAMVEAGYAWHYVKYNKKKRFAEAEARARKEKRGLWKSENAVAPWKWRKMSKEERAKQQRPLSKGTAS